MGKFYTYDEALAASIEYFGGDELAGDVFLKKYALKNDDGHILEKTPKDMHQRITNELVRIENNKFKKPLSSESIFNYFDKFKYFIPGGSPMSAIGNKYQVQSLSNCVVIPPVVDSYGGICLTDQQQAQLMKRRMGVGFCISNIRPKGMLTKNAARTTEGIGIFMERFSNTCREVAIQNRRGALMLCISVHHPEIETFIHIKKNLTKVTGANISIKVTDEFMNAVVHNKKYQLRWPIKNPKVTSEISARYIWDQIVDSAWACAEPGVLFWDTMQREGLSDQYKEINPSFEDTAPNPCTFQSSKVLTLTGMREIQDINVGEEIWSESGWTKVVNKIDQGVKPCFKYKTTFGSFSGTEDHKIISNNIKVPVGVAESLTILRGPFNLNLTLNSQDIMDGLVLGDGTYDKMSRKILLCIGYKDHDYFNSEIVNLMISPPKEIPVLYFNQRVITTITPKDLPYMWERNVPNNFKLGTKDKVCGFLRGLYTANGSICANRITLKSSSFGLIEDVQIMLSSVGITSYHTTNKPSLVKFSNGEYLCKQSYDLNITRDREKFQQLIGFIQIYKQEKLTSIIKKDAPSKHENLEKEIVSKEVLGDQHVYDITVDNATHTFWCDGINISNCGEISMGVDCCRLMCINLYSYINNPFTKHAKFDFELFDKHAQDAQRVMDDIVDLELEAVDKILEKIKNDPEPEHIKRVELEIWNKLRENCVLGRRTGLGITALGDALAALGLRYGSEESINTTEEIYKQLAISSMKSSCLMAKELGAFPLYDKKLETGHPFLERLFTASPEVKELHEKYGRRNISLTTTAPTGTISTQTQTSSGIEPVYALQYTRRRKISSEDRTAKVDFVDQNNDKWQTYLVSHDKFNIWKQVTGESDIKDSPYYKATANSIDWEASVDIQAVAQKWVTHSISKTCNLPSNATKELVNKVYLKAWKSGCKGFTIYRDGCRTGVLVENPTTKPTLQKHDAPKRPKTLPCDLYTYKMGSKRFLVVVGLLEGEPYEVFATEGKYDIDGNKTGEITKLKRGHYMVKMHDGEIIVANTDNALSEDEEVITRLVSSNLRHGADVSFIVQQIEKSRGMGSFGKSIARALKGYIKNGVKVHGEVCESCGSENLQRVEGCKTCMQCGVSKCG